MKIIAKMLTLAVFAAAAFSLQAKTVEIEGLDSLEYSEQNITAEPGEEITIKLTNNSELPADAMSHNLVVLVADADARAFDEAARDRKSTRLNSSHVAISYAVFCLKKKRTCSATHW